MINTIKIEKGSELELLNDVLESVSNETIVV
jgi:hypothetical protein